MPPRQMWLFRFGCWAAIFTAMVHLAGSLAGGFTAENETERQLIDLATTYHFSMPGGASRSFMDLVQGFSLGFSLFFLTLGATGLVVSRRGGSNALLMYGVARVAAISAATMLVISLVFFFIIPTMFIAAVTTCFAVAAVKAPGI